MVRTQLSEAAKRRVRAGRMLLTGKRCADIAEAVGVARQTVYTWKALLDEGGIEALRAVPDPGHPARLSDTQLAQVRAALLQSPTEHGFGTELWTLKRVGILIHRLTGVRFGQTQVWRILGALGFSPQKPEKRAIERDEDAVRAWKRRTWPVLKKSAARRPADRFRRRIGHQRTTDPGAYMGTQGGNAHHSVSLQLGPCLGDCRAYAQQLPVQAARGQHQKGRDRRLPQGAQGKSQAAAAGDLGWPAGTPQPPGTRALANYCPNTLTELHATARNKLNSAQKRPSIIAACWMQATLW